MEKVKKSKKIGKHYFQLVGKPHLYFKEEILVNFTPHRKMYHFEYVGKICKIEASDRPTIMIKNIILRLSYYLFLNLAISQINSS